MGRYEQSAILGPGMMANEQTADDHRRKSEPEVGFAHNKVYRHGKHGRYK
jgi:hypothetical protein